jgi:hypothetical protein
MFVLFPFYFWPLCCLFIDIWLLITLFGILRLFWLPPLVSSDFSDYPLWYPQTFLITPFDILRLFWLPPLISSDSSDYSLWYPQTFLITPFGILRLFWLSSLVSSDFSDYPLWYPQTFLITPFGILRLFWLPPLVSSDFSDILLSSEVDTVEWLCTFQFWDLSAQLFSTHFDFETTIFIINTLRLTLHKYELPFW